MIWKVLVMPTRAILWAGHRVISSSLKKTRPASCLMKPVMQLIRVVLPEPFGPMMP